MDHMIFVNCHKWLNAGINPRQLLFAFILLLFVWIPESEARPTIELENGRAKLAASCGTAHVKDLTGAIESELLEWCVKACEVHGYTQLTGFDLFAASDFSTLPKLGRAFWPIAEKITPQKCLPFQPLPQTREIGKKCLDYGKRIRVEGLLADYDGWG